MSRPRPSSRKAAKALGPGSLVPTTGDSGTNSDSRPPVDITALNAFLAHIGSYHADHIFVIGTEPWLYHYTDLGGVAGILEKQDLWLTHSRYLNDEAEMNVGHDVAKAVIDKALESEKDKDSERKTFLTRVRELIDKPYPEGVYVCCFCTKDNLLSQWRGYGANGNGVSLRFDSNGFSWITGPDSPHGGLMRLWRVFYKKQEHESIVEKALNFALNDSVPKPLEVKARQAADAIHFFIPTFKNKDFEDENECRLIFSPPPNRPVTPLFRPARGMLVPYLSLKELVGAQGFPDGLLPIKSALIGPSTNKRLNGESIAMLARKKGMKDFDFNLSSTPYRG
jgi:hypothetical protein